MEKAKERWLGITEGTASNLEAAVYRREGKTGPWPDPPAPQPEDIDAAAEIVHRIETATPLIHSRTLSKRYDRSVYLKLESLSPVRSFKHRGALVTAQRIAAEGQSRVITASTGNNGQGFAYAGARLGLSVTVVAPEKTLDEKVGAMLALGADVKIIGANLTESQEAAKELAVVLNAVYVEDGEDPGLMSGAATVLTELIEAVADLECAIVPVGGGNLIAGSLLSCAAAGSDLKVLGVQSTAAPGATLSWLTGGVASADCRTFAGGLATERPGSLAFRVMDRYLLSMALVDDEDLYTAVGITFDETGCLIEGAAAAPLAALERFSDQIDAGKVALIITGSWLSREQVRKSLGL